MCSYRTKNRRKFWTQTRLILLKRINFINTVKWSILDPKNFLDPDPKNFLDPDPKNFLNPDPKNLVKFEENSEKTKSNYFFEK